MKLREREQDIFRHALEALKKTTGLDARITELEPDLAKGRKADARVTIDANGQAYDYIAEVKQVDRFATLAEVKYQLGWHAEKLLLVAPRITIETAEKCRELDLQFIDTAGNAYLRQPGLFVLVKGLKPAGTEGFQWKEEGAKGKGTATNLRMIFALLCKPELLNAPYRDIKNVAGIALGAVGWVFFDLNARGLALGGKKKDDRVLVERQKLIQEWVTNYPIKLRPKLNPRKFTAPTKDWWKTVVITRYNAQWGGEAAAEKLTGYLRPEKLTVYFHTKEEKNNLTKFVVEHKLRADPQGDIEILDAFWDFQDEIEMTETAPPLLVYADLLATLDSRNLETAKLIYDKYITDTATKN